MKDAVNNNFECYLVACMGNYVNRNETKSKGVRIKSVHDKDYNVVLSDYGKEVIGILRKFIIDNPGAKIDLSEISKRYSK